MNKLKKIGEIVSQQVNPFIEYISQFTELTLRPSHCSELSNGVALIELFQLIKGFKLVGPFQEHPKTFSHRFSNLKLLLQSIQRYWNEQLQSEIEGNDIDIVQIGQYGSVSDIEKLLELFVKTAAKSEDNKMFIERILETSQETQQFLKKVIEKVLSPHLTESPRKEKEKRMIDRLIELDHENQKLQQIISTICQEKQELQMRLKAMTDLISEKSQEIQKLHSFISDETPQKRRNPSFPEASDRKDSQIDALKNQIVELNIRHEKEIQEMIRQIEKLSYKAHEYQKIKGQLELSHSIIATNREIIEDAQKMEKSLSYCKAELMDRQNMISVLKEKITAYDARFIEMDANQIQLKGQLERRNIQISQLSSKIQRISPRKSQNHHNLFLEFPQIVNTEADAYIETNRALRQQLERSRTSLEKTAAQLQSCRGELTLLRGCQNENKKLKELIVEQKSYKGEEIDVLVHALYYLRKKVKQGDELDQRALKSKNC